MSLTGAPSTGSAVLRLVSRCGIRANTAARNTTYTRRTECDVHQEYHIHWFRVYHIQQEYHTPQEYHIHQFRILGSIMEDLVLGELDGGALHGVGGVAPGVALWGQHHI